MRILLVEDDQKMTAHLEENFREQGFITTSLSSAEEVTEVLKSPLQVDVILMDRLLGPIDTKVFVPLVRKKWPQTPIIVLSAISTPNERTDLINLGADDYIGKPFSMQELIARIRASLRRSAPPGNFLQVGNLIIDSVKHIIFVGDKSENLPAKEFGLLRTLALDTARVWSKDELLDYVWGQINEVETNVVESTIANVRRKLEGLGANVMIKNMRNMGYWIAS